MLANIRWRAGRLPARSCRSNQAFRDDRGATIVEYALLLGLVAVVSVGSLFFLGGAVNNTAGNVALQVNTWGGSEPFPPSFTNPDSYSLVAHTGNQADPFLFTATGHPAPTFSASGLPAWLTLSPSGDLVDNGSDTAGTYQFTVTATNGISPDATQAFTLTVTPQPVAPQFTSATSTTFTAATSGETFTFTASGSPAPTFSAAASGTGQTWPVAGVSLSSTGALTDNGGDLAGIYTFTVTATNVVGSATQIFTLTVTGAQAPAFTNGNYFPLPVYSTGATTFVPNSATDSYTFTASGAPSPTFSATGLPSGVHLSTTGVLTDDGNDAPTTPGHPDNFTVTATNSAGTATQAFSLTIAIVAPAFTDGNLIPLPLYSTGSTTFAPDSSADSYTFTASGAPAPTFTATGLPSGVNLSTTGVLTDDGNDAPTTPGHLDHFTVTATNSAGTAAQAFTLTVATVGPAFTDGNLLPYPFYSTGAANFNPYSAADSYTFTASGTPAPSFSTGALPTGVHLSSGGVLTDDGTDPPGTFSLTVTATNTAGTATQAFTLTIGTSPNFTDGDAYDGYATGSTTFTAGESTDSYTFTATGNPAPTFTHSALPAGINLSSSGVLTDSGTDVATAPGHPDQFTVTASNGVTPDATQTFSLTVHAQQAPAFTNGNPPNYSTGDAQFPTSGGTYTFTASGYPTPTFSSADLPAGVTLSAAGLLADTGSATANIYIFHVTATNPIGTKTQTFTLTVGVAPQFTNGNYDSTPHYSTGATDFPAAGGTYTFTASGDPSPTFGATGLPANVTISQTGTLTDTGAQATGTYTFTVTAMNAVGTATQTFTLSVGTPPIITSANNANFTPMVNTDSFTVTATGYPTPTLAVTGLPTGVSFNPATGALTDTGNDAAGIYTLHITASNGVAPAATQTFTLTIGTPPTITSADNADFTNASHSFTAMATGNPTPTFSLSNLNGAPVAINANTGALTYSGSYSHHSAYNFTINATNAVGADHQAFTLNIN